jgi:hypothetical protein
VQHVKPARRSPSHDSLEADSRSQSVECTEERFVEGRRAANARLEVKRLHQQRSFGAVRLQVRSADDPVAPEEGKDVVPIAALGLSLVDRMTWSKPKMRRTNRRSHSRLSNGERSTAAEGRGGSGTAPAGTSTEAPI